MPGQNAHFMRLSTISGVPKFETVRARGFGRGSRCLTTRAFTIVEILVVILLMAVLVIAAISAITLLDRSSRRQAVYTTALEVAQGKLDQLLATPYNPPDAPFTPSTYVQQQPATLSINRNGTAVTSQALVTTTLEQVLNGHMATVVVSYTNFSQPATVQLQTLINKLSGGQR